jgi:hypothetical protein
MCLGRLVCCGQRGDWDAVEAAGQVVDVQVAASNHQPDQEDKAGPGRNDDPLQPSPLSLRRTLWFWPAGFLSLAGKEILLLCGRVGHCVFPPQAHWLDPLPMLSDHFFCSYLAQAQDHGE